MRKVWVLDTSTKGTGAQMVPLEKVLTKPEAEPASRPRTRRARTSAPGQASARRDREGNAARSPAPTPEQKRGQTIAGPLPAGHVRKKATGELGRVRSVDSKAGTASVLWLRQGRTSTVPLSAISRR